ncbi:MAG: UvrD-helicase domain-containing protein [bacterium]|nr:UvrD-helicase domain-containing protein [bacterium]
MFMSKSPSTAYADPATTRNLSQIDLLRTLNPEQRDAVETIEGPLLIFAGAGSGKTRVLTHRIVNLVRNHNVKPEEVLAVTFTNKAAREMRERITSLFCREAVPRWVSTFHSFGTQIMRRHAELLGFTPNFAIYDSNDSLSLLKRIFKKLDVNPKTLDPKSLRNMIDRAKNSYISPEGFAKTLHIPPGEAWLAEQIYSAYQNELRENNALDFGDLLCHPLTLLTLEKGLCEHYQDKFRYILVDEYQDTNRVQYLLINTLAGKHKNLCVVGDDDQSIYAFRGASVENILQFNKDYPGAKKVTLCQNYRSSGNILQAANSVISRNKNRECKNMVTSNAPGSEITVFCGYDEHNEAEYIAREISLLLEHDTPAKEIAVFYRTNAQSRALEEAFCHNGIAYEIHGGHKFYDRKEVKDILSYASLTINNRDSEALLRIINTPARSIGAKTLAAILTLADELKLSALETIEGIAQGKIALKVSAKALSGLCSFSSLMLKLNEELADVSQKLGEISLNAQAMSAEESLQTINCLALFLKTIAEDSGYINKLKLDGSEESLSRIENIRELYEVAAEFVSKALERRDSTSVQDFLDRASLSSDAEQENLKSSADGARQSVTLMTLHLAKGLEFDSVFLSGVEEGVIPHVRSLNSTEDMEEERRLCYVGITRARKNLFLTRAESRRKMSAGNWCSGRVSRFAYDIPREITRESGWGFWN